MNALPITIQQDILTQYEPLVHHVLKRLSINPLSSDYDDFAQVARIALLHAAHHTKVNPLSKIEKDRYQFISFARSRMLWAVTDELRKLGNYKDKETTVEMSRPPKVRPKNLTFGGIFMTKYSLETKL
ncbi:hypothetical protein CJ205_07220, partial [Dolosicoccus paucivorans]